MHKATFQDSTPLAFDRTGERQMMHSTTKLTRVLLICGLIAGPFYIVVGLIQASTFFWSGSDLGADPSGCLRCRTHRRWLLHG